MYRYLSARIDEQHYQKLLRETEKLRTSVSARLREIITTTGYRAPETGKLTKVVTVFADEKLIDYTQKKKGELTTSEYIRGVVYAHFNDSFVKRFFRSIKRALRR